MYARTMLRLLIGLGVLAHAGSADSQPGNGGKGSVNRSAVNTRLFDPNKDKGIIRPTIPKVFSFDLAVLSVAPAEQVLEHQEIQVQYELTVSVIGIVGEPAPTSVSIGSATGHGTRSDIGRVSARKYRGTIQCRAPAAGSHAAVVIRAYEPTIQELHENVVAEAEHRMPVAARYEISVDSYTITNTRALHEDRVKISLRSHVEGHPFAGDNACGIAATQYCVLLADQGDRNNGTHAVPNVRVGPFDLVPELSPNIGFEFDVTNLGESYDQHRLEVILNGMSLGASGVLGAVMSGSQFGGLHEFAKMLHGLGKCDGPLAVEGKLLLNRSDRVLATAPTLDALTRSTGRYSETRFHPGVDSGLGCGSNSQYWVTWSVTRTSWQQ